MSGKKSAEKSSGGGGIKSFFASKPTPQSKVNEVSPQSAASEENCIDLSKEEKTGKKQANSKTPEPNLFFMSKSQRQQTLAAQREAKEKEIQRQREAEELLIAQQREARIQEEIIRSRKETNLLLLGKSAGEASGSKSHNPFFLARAPAPVKTSQSGSMASGSNLVAEVVDLPEVHFPSTQNVGLEGRLGALLQQIESYNNDFCKRPALNATPDTDALAVTQMCVPDWAETAFSDLTAQEYSASFALPRGRGGEHSANRAATGQARMYPLAQASLNLRALWLLWVQRTLTEDKASTSDVNNSNNNTGVLKVPMKVSPSSLTLPESAKNDSGDAVSAVDRSPTAILTRWLSDWAAKRARSTGNSSTNDLALTACNINNKNSKSKASHATPSLTRTSSRSLASSAGSNVGGKGRPSRNNSVKKGSDVLKRRRGGVVRDDSDDEKDDVDDDVDAIEDSSAEEEDEEEEEQAGSDGEEDEWQSSAAEEEEGSESEVEYGRSGRRRQSTTTSNSSRQLSSRGGIADEEQLLNVMVLEGPSGSGKSASVHETARLLGYKVIEVNASHLRNGASIKKLISEAAQSAHIMDNMSGSAALGNGGIGAAATEMNLILFDEVDITCDEEDAQLHHTIQNLAHISKCPILLTSEQPLPFFKALHAKYVKFTRPDVSACCSGEANVDYEGASDALQCLVQNIRALSGAALSKGNGSTSSSHAASYNDVTVLDDGIAKHGNTSKSSSSAALAAMFGSAKKPIIQLDATIGAADSGRALPPLPPSALASFSPADLMRLQVLCGLSDGDLRAALSSVQLFPEHFLGATKPAPTTATAVPSSGRTSPFVPSSAVVDLTSSPAAVKRRVSHAGLVDLTSPPEIEDVSRQEPGCSFGRFLSETLKLDFALFDSSLGVLDDLLKSAAPPNDDNHKMTLDAATSTETTVAIASDISTSNSELYAPVVHDVQPRYGLVAGGFLMTITGAHFLQHSARSLPSSDSDDHAPHPAEVRVFLNGHVSCPCVLKSDTSIVAYVPPMRREGVYTVHVEVHVALPVPATHKVLVARSVSTGVGAAWIHLRQRYFPLMRSAHNSSQKLLVAPAQNRATVRDDSQSTDDLSPGAASSSSSDEGRAVNDNTESGNGNRRVAKRLWSCTQDPSEQADNTPSTSEQGGASSSNSNNQRRKRRVISDDSDEASDNDSEAEGRKEKAAREKDRNLEEDEDAMSLAQSDEDEAVTDAPNSSSSASKPAASASTADASMLQSLVEKVQSSLLATLNRVKGNGHSEPFLLPVDDRDVPGYSQEIARPMDLSTITESLKEGLYSAPRSLVVNALTGELMCQNNFPDVVSFVEDVRLIWSNCVQFNDKDSPFTRSAYLISCLFDSTLRDMLQSAFVSFPGAKVLSEDRNGAYICVRLEFNGENVFLVPRCTSFDRCMKLRKVLAPPRIRSLLAERQMSDNSSGGNGDNGIVGTSSQNPVPHTAAVGLVSHNGSLLHPASTTQPFLTAEEALAPERADATSADKSAVVAALNEAQAKRQLLLNKTPSKKNLVPGLQSVVHVSRSSTEGLEYEDDECAPIVVLTTGTASAAVHAASQADLSALSQLSARSEAFSVADRFTSVATSLAEYNCLQHEDEATDCAERCWTSSNTSVSAHEGSRSYAQIYNASRYYSMYGDCFRQGALQVMADNVRANVDALQQSSYSSKELPACRKKSGYAYLGSAYLEHNLRRTEHMRLLSIVANKYTSSTGNRAGSAWVCGLIVQHTLPSLCCVPRALTVDVFPLVGVMCRSEMNNDADEEYQQQRRLTEYSSEMSGLGRRSSRRGNSGEKEPELARKHKCFVEMKTILNNTDEKIIRQLAVAYDGCC